MLPELGSDNGHATMTEPRHCCTKERLRAAGAGQKSLEPRHLNRLCCTNELRVSSRESSMIARAHEQLGPYELQDHELVNLQ